MDPISESDLQSTPSPTSSSLPVSFHSAKMPASPRARPGMPAGPRVRKPTQNSTNISSLNGTPNTNGRRVSSETAAFTSGGNSPTLSATGSAQSLPAERNNPHLPLTDEKQIQTDGVPSRAGSPNLPSRLAPTPEATRPSTPLSTPGGYKVVSKPATLPFPKPINFVGEPIPFRGLTLEAAQWTFTSDQLRDIVSKAIRDSAKEPFIRLLSSEILENEMPVESERLESLKSITQAQHRFHFQRRTNLLQALNALATTTRVSADGSNPLASLTSQLAEIASAMDRFAETLLHVADQRAQMAHIQDIHVSSALAMALRKLNASYSKRTADLKKAKSRIEELEAELEEAWKAAQDLAQEVDDLDHFEEKYGMDDELDDDEEAAVDKGGLMFDVEDFTAMSVANAQVVGITGTAFASTASLVSPPSTSTTPPTMTPHKRSSSRSTSINGGKVVDGERTSKVRAARKRSSRASKASLRIPKSLSAPTSGSEAGSAPNTAVKRSRSKSNVKKTSTEPPSIPPMPSGLDKSNGDMINTSFLELSQPGTPQPSSEDDIPPVPTLVNIIGPKEEEESQVGLKDDDKPTVGFDCSLIPPLPIKTDPHLLRQKSVDNGLDQLNRLHAPPDSHLTQTRRVQSMLPSTTAPALVDHEPVNSDEDSSIIPGTSRPASQDDPLVVPLPEDDAKQDLTEYNKFDRWPWSQTNKPPPPTRPVPLPPPSPTPSLLPELPPPAEDNSGSQRLKDVPSSFFRFKSRRNSMPLPSAAIAALLPWRGESKKQSSEPHLPSQGGPRAASPRASFS